MTYGSATLLSKINSPADLKKLDINELNSLASEVRNYIIETITQTGGHLAASLGTVELSIALHYVFDTPDDKLVWDVGHQAYAHKILTGRRDAFPTNRKSGGISGFPKMSESEYDAFGTGHASTSISAILGMAEASRLNGNNSRSHVAVIGDGALSGGMAFEALNNAGVSDANMLVILNDNRISIDASVGALKDYLIRTSTSPSFNRIRLRLWQFMGGINKLGPNSRAFMAKLEHRFKTYLFKESNLFESLRFRYFGPVNGHDIPKLVRMLTELKEIEGPKLLHVMTVKGKGYEPAEKFQTKYHSVSAYSPKVSKKEEEERDAESTKFQDVFGKTLVDLADLDKKVVGITPAMPTGSSLTYLIDKYPERAFDVGIAEQHAVTFSAGLAADGLKPYCVIYSTFLQRGYDQLIHDVCLQNLPVVFCVDRAGIVGEDGATHHGIFDLAYLRIIPNLVVASPMNEEELRMMMYSALSTKGPYSIRYPRGKGVMQDWQKEFKNIETGKGRILSKGSNLAILSIGHIGNNVALALKSIGNQAMQFTHADMRFVKPLDELMLHDIMKNHEIIMTVEDGCIQGGFGTAILEFMNTHNYQKKVICLGIPDQFVGHAEVNELHALCGIDQQSIAEKIIEITRN
ncbi:1-deoxy-D-xylulose-5-phosphate synthase [Bacteroidota bacterium]